MRFAPLKAEVSSHSHCLLSNGVQFSVLVLISTQNCTPYKPIGIRNFYALFVKSKPPLAHGFEKFFCQGKAGGIANDGIGEAIGTLSCGLFCRYIT